MTHYTVPLHDIVFNQINNKEFFVWDAVVAWRDHIYQAGFWSTTKSSYLTSMLKLIESEVINVCIQLHKIDEDWLKEAKQKINDKSEWSLSTKIVRKSCLNSFYNFIQKDFDRKILPYRRHPESNEIKHILSSVQDKALTKDISPIVLCNEISKINERDAYIVWLMMWTGQTLESILDRRKEDLRTPYLDFEDDSGKRFSKHILEHITNALEKLCKDSSVYLFETANSKRILRTQVMRNLKQAGYNIGLDFDLTPKVLHGYVCAYMSRDKRSELEKALGISIN